MAPLQAIAVYGRMIKFSHSVFALPFAFSGALLAAMHAGITPAQIGWIALAMVGARSAAMGFNRLVDRHLDAANPPHPKPRIAARRGLAASRGGVRGSVRLGLGLGGLPAQPFVLLSVAAGFGRALVLLADQALYLGFPLGFGAEFGRGTAGRLDCGHWWF